MGGEQAALDKALAALVGLVEVAVAEELHGTLRVEIVVRAGKILFHRKQTDYTSTHE